MALTAPATAAAATTFEAESMSVLSGVANVTNDAAASGGKATTLLGNATLTRTLTTDAGGRVVVRARGEQCEGAPSMLVQVDGKSVLTASVSATGFTDYAAAATVSAGSHVVRVTFSNDLLRSGTCDRNLIVDRVTFEAAQTVVQAESLTLAQAAPHGEVVSEASASGGKAVLMRSGNSASASVSTPATTNIVVRARGIQCSGAPQVVVKVDGKQVLSSAVSSTTYADYRATVALTQGAHTVNVAYTNDYLSTACDRNLYVDSVAFVAGSAAATQPASPTPTPTPAPTTGGNASNPPATSGYWSSSFENGAQEPTEWSTWSPSSLYGAWGPGLSNSIGTAQSFGLPRSKDGTANVARFYHAASDPAIHHKLYREWRANTWPSAVGALTEKSSPANVSGRYIADLYIPTPKAADSTSLLTQFKESYIDTNGGFHNESGWWFWMDGASANSTYNFHLTAPNFVSHSAPIPAAPYFNKWVTVEMRVIQGQRLELYLDGVLKATGSNSSYPVGRRFQAGGAGLNGDTVANPSGWIYGAGNYAVTNKETLVYVDNAKLLPLSTAG